MWPQILRIAEIPDEEGRKGGEMAYNLPLTDQHLPLVLSSDRKAAWLCGGHVKSSVRDLTGCPILCLALTLKTSSRNNGW